LVTVGVTGAPRLWWDESDDQFTFTHGVAIDAGAVNVNTADGIDIAPGADLDADLITVNVTGDVRFWWDESEDRLSFSKDIWVEGTARAQALYLSSGSLEHAGSQIGFFGTTPTSKGTVTGSRGGNAALADLLTELANYGLITDSTT
jgi:hypothetical protein